MLINERTTKKTIKTTMMPTAKSAIRMSEPMLFSIIPFPLTKFPNHESILMHRHNFDGTAALDHAGLGLHIEPLAANHRHAGGPQHRLGDPFAPDPFLHSLRRGAGTRFHLCQNHFSADSRPREIFDGGITHTEAQRYFH